MERAKGLDWSNVYGLSITHRSEWSAWTESVLKGPQRSCNVQKGRRRTLMIREQTFAGFSSVLFRALVRCGVLPAAGQAV